MIKSAAVLTAVLKTAGLPKFVKDNAVPLTGAGLMGGALGTNAVLNAPPTVEPDKMSFDPTPGVGEAQRTETVQHTPGMEPAAKGSTGDYLGQAKSVGMDVLDGAKNVGADILSRGKQLGGQAVDWAKANPALAAGGLGAAGILAALLLRKKKRTKTAAFKMPNPMPAAKGLAGDALAGAKARPVTTSLAATGAAGAAAVPMAMGKPAPAAPVAPKPAPGLLDQGKEMAGGLYDKGVGALKEYGSNIAAGDPKTLALTGLGVGAAGVLAYLLRKQDDEE